MDVNQSDPLCRAGVFLHNGAETLVGPRGACPAEEHAIGKYVLATRDRGLQGPDAAIGIAPRLERGISLGPSGTVPIGWNQQIVNLGIARVVRRRFGEIQKIPVEIDIVLGHPADMEKP